MQIKTIKAILKVRTINNSEMSGIVEILPDEKEEKQPWLN